MNRYSNMAIGIVLLFGLTLFYMGTDGFRAFTAETARVNNLIEEKPTFPNVTFQDSKERAYSIDEFKGKYVLVTFIYASCTTMCIELEMNTAEIVEQIPADYMGKEIVFLSVSFDPKRDTPAVLDQYRQIFDSDGETWRMARIEDQNKLDSLLKKFGVIVIPDDYGNFTHNAAFYLIDKTGTLIEVLDYKKSDEAAKKIVKILDTEARGNL
ncbi:SCO family protein [Filibacter tadaridae]|uniref:Thioredoxin domain-containing protein n=1 Tax=Filibacter tadaridae TaxID=2483811 RepID=A0A3P5XKA8_9BACL|nr:SCO family protein [Filibacter tadaridae]VDC28106.1 hypothetical protein FILTAD_01727 [Filibacter tadaridae]